MPNSRSLGSLFVAGVIASQGVSCGGSVRARPDDLQAAGSTSGARSVEPGGTGAGGLLGASGSHQVSGGTGSTGGSASVAGTAGAGGTTGAAGGTEGAEGGRGGAAEEPNKVILFDGSRESFDQWVPRLGTKDDVNPWQDNGDGTMSARPAASDILSKQKFRNVFVHLEYATAEAPGLGGERDRDASGVMLNGSYELQILDSYGSPPSIWSCGAVSGVLAPQEVACHQHDVWNTYEIEFQAPICGESGNVETPARFAEVKLNGTLIHRNVELQQPTLGGLAESCEARGLMLPNWSSASLPPKFRNIWAIPRD